jgi:hypothetical protein
MAPITSAGLTATPLSDELAGYGNSLPGVFRVHSKTHWRIDGAGERLRVLVTHAADGVRIQAYHPAGIYTWIGEAMLPGSGMADPLEAIGALLRALQFVRSVFDWLCAPHPNTPRGGVSERSERTAPRGGAEGPE